MSARRLPVLATVLHGWRLLAADWWVLLRIVALPLAVLAALDFYLDALWWGSFDRFPGASREFVDHALSNLLVLDRLLALILGGMMIALWQRVRIAGRQILSVLGLLAAWRNIAALTVLWCSLLVITVGVIRVFDSLMLRLADDPLDRFLVVRLGLADKAVLYSVIDDLVLQGVPLVVTMHIGGRLGLMLWARPGGGDGALDRAWAAGAGNGWRLAAAIFLALLPVTVLASVLEASDIAEGTLYFVLSFDFSNLLQLIVAVAVLAAAHGALLGNEAATETPARADATNP